MPHLSPMQWMMMFISTWMFTLMISTKMSFSTKSYIIQKKTIINTNNNNWNMYSSIKMNCKFIIWLQPLDIFSMLSTFILQMNS